MVTCTYTTCSHCVRCVLPTLVKITNIKKYNNNNNNKKVLEYLVYKDLVLVYITLELVLHAAKCSSKSGRVHDGVETSSNVFSCSAIEVVLYPGGDNQK